MHLLRLFKWRFRWERDVEGVLDAQGRRIDELKQRIDELSTHAHDHRSGVGRGGFTAESQYGVVYHPAPGDPCGNPPPK